MQSEGEHQEEDAYLERMNLMKLYDFKQQQEERTKQRVFAVLRAHPKTMEQKARWHYRMSLCCKGYISLLKYNTITRHFAAKIQDFDFGLNLSIHFNAIRQYHEQAAQQREEQVQTIKRNRKSQALKLIRKIHKDNKKSQTQHLTEKIDQISGKINQADTLTPLPLPHAYTSRHSRLLGDSRRSMMSNQSAIEQIQARRKFTAVREIPQMPPLPPKRQETVVTPVTQELVGEDQIKGQQNEEKIQEAKQVVSQVPNIQTRQTKATESKYQKQQVPTNPNKNETKSNEKVEECLQLAAQLKVTQINTIKDILSQSRQYMSPSVQSQYEKYLQSSVSLVKRIINLSE